MIGHLSGAAGPETALIPHSHRASSTDHRSVQRSWRVGPGGALQGAIPTCEPGLTRVQMEERMRGDPPRPGTESCGPSPRYIPFADGRGHRRRAAGVRCWRHGLYPAISPFVRAAWLVHCGQPKPVHPGGTPDRPVAWGWAVNGLGKKIHTYWQLATAIVA